MINSYKKRITILGLALFSLNSFANGHNHEGKNGEIWFKDVTQAVGLTSVPTWKYGGPTIADLNQDGFLDAILPNHHEQPAQLFWNENGKTLSEHATPIAKWDLHGTAAGDFDLDGDLDVLVAMGGGNGKKPSPPRLMRNDNGNFVDVTIEAGLGERGARGRSVRWIDLDKDGYLDIILLNAEKVINEDITKNLVYKNLGNGKFEYIPSPVFDEIVGERILLTDLNNDTNPDLVIFTPLSILINQGGFQFVDKTTRYLGESSEFDFITSAAATDFDNDGDQDIYLARGKVYYQIANNSLDFYKDTKRVDFRDEGNKSRDGFNFTADNEITLTDFFLWPRGYKGTFEYYLGKNKAPLSTSVAKHKISKNDAQGWPENLEDNGIYIGYLGDNQWRIEWLLKENLAWDIRQSISGVTQVQLAWQPQNRNVPDILLRNDGDKFTDISSQMNIPTLGNHQGVTHGDFNNDGYDDLFLSRFGKLHGRVSDLFLINQAGEGFQAIEGHGAFDKNDKGHGDAGQAFDYNRDGKLDLIHGSDNPGTWYLYQNIRAVQNYLLINLGYSESDKSIDALAAKVTINTEDGSFTKYVSSRGASHAQSMHSLLHFGLADAEQIQKVEVTWRDGTSKTLQNIKANQIISIGQFSPIRTKH